MARIVYLNGSYVPEDEARISIFDRGTLMGDAVYEVTVVLDGMLIEFPLHMERLERSQRELEIPALLDREALLEMHRNLVARNTLSEGVIYVQVSRGPAERDFPFPDSPVPTVFAFSQERDWRNAPSARNGLRVISVPEGRWARRDIKSVQLLWSCMSKTRALREGADDVLFVENGLVTETSAANVFIVKDGRVTTRPRSNAILHGVTRRVILNLCRQEGFRFEERGFSVEEAQSADEVFATASPLFATGIVEIDGVTIGDGTPGPTTTALREMHIRESLRSAM